jgi:hypothetical protein
MNIYIDDENNDINMAMSRDIAMMWNHLSNSIAFTTSTYR